MSLNDTKKTNDNIIEDEVLENNNNNEAGTENNTEECNSAEKEKSTAENEGAKVINDELKSLKGQLEAKSRKCDEYMDLLQRKAAEFDNYKKRTIKEKESLYSDAVADAVSSFLPVADNMERALLACSKEGDISSLREGVEMTFKQLNEVFKNFGVEEIKSVGKKFDPNVHNAVMHIEDDTYGDNEVIEEFQKGYKVKDKVIRYSMVKVAN